MALSSHPHTSTIYSYGWAYSIEWLCRPSTHFNHLLLRNRWANQSQISYGFLLGWGNESLFKVTKMAAIPIYGKNSSEIFFSETSRPMTFELVYSINDSGPTKFLQMMIQGWPGPTSQLNQLCSLMLLYGKTYKSIKIGAKLIHRDYWSLWTESW